MYESHFGLSACPFQLNPDPSFYFDSKGHSSALSYLRFGAYQGEGFIVVTGEIGAGKTTLVRALLAELDPRKIVAAQVVSTQLEAGDLLRSILAAFGIPSASPSKAQLIASLEAFLTTLATKGQRALLIVDEAQNLNLQAVEELRMLSNFQFDQHALLQSFLVGQPELRRLLQSKSMEQLRQRVIASCHLGPLDAAETQAYVEHRLRHVGWQQRPTFEAAAFDTIHRWTGGIPRRINLLCNRLLLAAFLGNDPNIASASIDIVAGDLGAELGEKAPAGPRDRPRKAAKGDAPAGARDSSNDAAIEVVEGSRIGTATAGDGEISRTYRTPGVTPGNPIVCVADTAMDFLKARALCASMEEAGGLSGLVTVTPHGQAGLRCDEIALRCIAPAPLEIYLGVPASVCVDTMAAAMQRFDVVLDELRPSAVLAIGSGNAVLACSLVAIKRNLPFVHIDGGLRCPTAGDPAAVNGALIDRLASAIVIRRVSFHYTLAREGIPADRILCLGSLMGNVVHLLRAIAPKAPDVIRRFGLSPSILTGPSGFGVMTLRIAKGRRPDTQIVAFLGQLQRTLPIFWIADSATCSAIETAGLELSLDRARVSLLPTLGLVEEIALLAQAALLIVDSHRLLCEEADTLGVPWVDFSTTEAPGRADVAEGPGAPTDAKQTVGAINDIIAHRVAREDVPEHWDGGAGRRIAEHMRRLLAS